MARTGLGFVALRPAQREAIESILAGRDTLAVMPTGSGKSAIYQIAAYLLPGPTVVVSPLIALQQDQVTSLEDRPLGDAVAVNSAVGRRRRRDALVDLARGNVEFVFLSPEQLGNRDTLGRLRATRPALLVVDEAHCVSQWGPDFRPWYLQLASAAQALGAPPLLALTATASPPVRRDIVERLGMRDPHVIVADFDRPNIWLGVEPATDAIAKRNALVERVCLADEPGIVYGATRGAVETLAAALRQRGVSAVAYHAGLGAKTREAAQRDFMEGRVPVIVATNAFGMGIDKPDVRFVLHHDAPESLDAYYQEIGRGGRDGKPATAVLFHEPDELRLQRFFAAGGRLRARDVVRVADAIHRARRGTHVDDLRVALRLSLAKVTRTVAELERHGIVTMRAGGLVRPAGRPDDAAALAERIVRLDEERRGRALLQVELMRTYAEMQGCRRGFLLEHFGQIAPLRCGRCDTCAAQPAGDDDVHPRVTRVVHRTYGPGLLLNRVAGGGDAVLVLFHSLGQKAVPMHELALGHRRRTSAVVDGQYDGASTSRRRSRIERARTSSKTPNAIE